jgi:predicted HTH domain antitoxin
MTMSVLSVRLDAELEEKLEILLKSQPFLEKSSYIRQLLHQTVNIALIDFLCDQVRKKIITAWKAAEKAKIPLRQMFDELAKRNILTYDQEAYEQDLEYINCE